MRAIAALLTGNAEQTGEFRQGAVAVADRIKRSNRHQKMMKYPAAPERAAGARQRRSTMESASAFRVGTRVCDKDIDAPNQSGCDTPSDNHAVLQERHKADTSSTQGRNKVVGKAETGYAARPASRKIAEKKSIRKLLW
jgi:hypothetical protein